MNIVIPMAGAGARFFNEGYTKPKPLIEIEGETMIEKVVNNINIDGNYIFVVQKDHVEKYNLIDYLSKLKKNCRVVISDKLTEGAACTVLLAQEYIDNKEPLFICDSDSLAKYDSNHFVKSVGDYNGAILTFYGQDPNLSYAKIDEDAIIEVAEKNKISDTAICGRYFWGQGRDFVYYAKLMISKNQKIKNEFYVAPVYNLAIKEGFKILNYHVEDFSNLGTPFDLNLYLNK